MLHETNTIRLSDTDRGIRAAVAMLRAGQLVAIPTETVYGLAADAANPRAVAAIFEAKGRPRFNPLIVHVHASSEINALAVMDDRAARLADAMEFRREAEAQTPGGGAAEGSRASG